MAILLKRSQGTATITSGKFAAGVGVLLSIATVRILPRIVLVGRIDARLRSCVGIAAFIPARGAHVDPTNSLRAD